MWKFQWRIMYDCINEQWLDPTFWPYNDDSETRAVWEDPCTDSTSWEQDEDYPCEYIWYICYGDDIENMPPYPEEEAPSLATLPGTPAGSCCDCSEAVIDCMPTVDNGGWVVHNCDPSRLICGPCDCAIACAVGEDFCDYCLSWGPGDYSEENPWEGFDCAGEPFVTCSPSNGLPPDDRVVLDPTDYYCDGYTFSAECRDIQNSNVTQGGVPTRISVYYYDEELEDNVFVCYIYIKAPTFVWDCYTPVIDDPLEYGDDCYGCFDLVDEIVPPDPPTGLPPRCCTGCYAQWELSYDCEADPPEWVVITDSLQCILWADISPAPTGNTREWTVDGCTATAWDWVEFNCTEENPCTAITMPDLPVAPECPCAE